MARRPVPPTLDEVVSLAATQLVTEDEYARLLAVCTPAGGFPKRKAPWRDAWHWRWLIARRRLARWLRS